MTLDAPLTDGATATDHRRWHDTTSFVLGGRRGLRSRDNGAGGTWAGLAIIAVLVILPLRGLYRFTGGTMEEGFMLYFPERMWKGDVPNVDFLHLYGPGALHVLMGWYRIFGDTLAAERTFGLIQHVAIIAALFTLARPWGRAAATAVGALSVFYILTPIGLTAMAWNGGLALVLWGGVFAVRSRFVADAARTRSLVVAGLLGGLALTYRPDLVIAVAAIAVWLVLVDRSTWRPLVLGGVVGLVPMWVHLAMAGFAASWRGMVTDPVFHLRAGRELPRPPSWSRLDGALQAIAETEPPWFPLPHLAASNAITLWFFAMVGLTLALLVFALWHRRTHRDGRSAVLLVVALVSVAIISQGLQRPDSTHLTWVTCISWPFGIVIVAEAVERLRPAVSMRRAVAVGGGVALVLTFALTSLFTFRYYLLHARVSLGRVPSAFEVGRGDRVFHFGSWAAADATQRIVDDLDALVEPGDRLFVGPADLRRTWYSDVIFYWMFPEMDPATYFIEMDPGLANAEGSRLADDLRTADYVILTNFWAGWWEPNSSIDYGDPAANEVLRDQFCQWSSYHNDLAMLFYRCR